MTAPYITRRSIRAEEEREFEGAFGASGSTVTSTTWTAELDGYLSTGERVEMSRTGSTFAKAVAALEAAIAENGWTIKERGTR